MTMIEVEARLAALEAEVASLKRQLADQQDDRGLVDEVNEGLAAFERGEAVSAMKVVKELGRKYGVDRSSRMRSSFRPKR